MAKIILYVLVLPIVVFSMDSVNFNAIFKRDKDNYYQARVMYMLVIVSISYLVVSFINDFLGVFS